MVSDFHSCIDVNFRLRKFRISLRHIQVYHLEQSMFTIHLINRNTVDP